MERTAVTKGPDGKSGREKTRDERLAEALRANLRKRKSAPPEKPKLAAPKSAEPDAKQ